MDARGTNFCLFSETAKAVELCLFDAEGRERRLALPGRDGPYWHGYVPGIGHGQRYGYRVYGPYEPAAGHRGNPNKLLIDPYARAVDGRVRWDPAVFGHAGSDAFGSCSPAASSTGRIESSSAM